MTMLWINVLLAIPFIALWAGIPMWLVLRRPDTKPAIAAAPAVGRCPWCATKTPPTAASPSPACGRASRSWLPAPTTTYRQQRRMTGDRGPGGQV